MSSVDPTAAESAQPVLITGANGQLGRRLIERLARCHPPIRARAVVRSPGAAESLQGLSASARVETVVLDYRDEEALTEAARGCRYGVHLVGIIAESSKSRYEDAHQAASRALARAAQTAGLQRLVYLSILGADPDSSNPCLRSKGLAERILLESGTPTLILRVPMVLGPGDTTSGIVRAEARARLLPLAAGGRSLAQPIFADDVIEAIVAGTSRTDLDDVSVDLAGPESLPQRELIERAGALYGRRPRFVSVPRRALDWLAWLAERLMADPPFTRASLEVILADDDVDPEPARRRLGIQLTPLDEILRRCVGPEAPR